MDTFISLFSYRAMLGSGGSEDCGCRSWNNGIAKDLKRQRRAMQKVMLCIAKLIEMSIAHSASLHRHGMACDMMGRFDRPNLMAEPFPLPKNRNLEEAGPLAALALSPSLRAIPSILPKMTRFRAASGHLIFYSNRSTHPSDQTNSSIHN